MPYSHRATGTAATADIRAAPPAMVAAGPAVPVVRREPGVRMIVVMVMAVMRVVMMVVVMRMVMWHDRFPLYLKIHLKIDRKIHVRS